VTEIGGNGATITRTLTVLVIATDPTDPSLNPTPTNTQSGASTPMASSSAGTKSALTSTTDGSSDRPTPTISSAPAAVSSGIPPGAAAGLAIGCLIAGLLIGLLAAFFFFRSRKRGSDTSPVGPESLENKGPYSGSGSGSTTQDEPLQLSQFILDATPDKDLTFELQSLGPLIEQHVESHYHLHHAQADPRALSQALASLGFGNGDTLAVDVLVPLALNPQTRQTALRHILSQVLFSSIDFGARSPLSMLPAPVAAFQQSIPPVENYGGSAEAVSTALSRWRTLSAFLLHQHRSQRTPLVPSEVAIVPQAAALVNALNSFLDPFVPPEGKQQQATHLQDVTVVFTKFGYVLFSQPGDWRLNLSTRGYQTGVRLAVVCAGLDKLGGRDGKPYGAPKSVVAATVVQV